MVSVLVVTINALKQVDITRPYWLVSGETLITDDFSPGEARLYLIASILEENKHRGHATCAKYYNACPKRLLQQSFFAKSLVFSTIPKGGQRLCGEEKQAKILPITSVYGARTKDSLTWKVIQRVLSEPNGL